MARYRYPNPYSAEAVTPSDSSDLTNPSVLYVGGAGNLKVTSAKNSGTVTFNNLAAGDFLPVVVTRVWSGSTTCSNIISMW